jgi:hypothetical protein
VSEGCRQLQERPPAVPLSSTRNVINLSDIDIMWINWQVWNDPGDTHTTGQTRSDFWWHHISFSICRNSVAVKNDTDCIVPWSFFPTSCPYHHRAQTNLHEAWNWPSTSVLCRGKNSCCFLRLVIYTEVICVHCRLWVSVTFMCRVSCSSFVVRSFFLCNF